MDGPRTFRMMAGYNRWMNERLFSLCATLSDEERKRDRKAFFHSLHGTLNHLLLTDRSWLGRFTGVEVSDSLARSGAVRRIRGSAPRA